MLCFHVRTSLFRYSSRNYNRYRPHVVLDCDTFGGHMMKKMIVALSVMFVTGFHQSYFATNKIRWRIQGGLYQPGVVQRRRLFDAGAIPSSGLVRDKFGQHVQRSHSRHPSIGLPRTAASWLQFGGVRRRRIERSVSCLAPETRRPRLSSAWFQAGKASGNTRRRKARSESH